MTGLASAAAEFLSHRRIAVAGVSRDQPNAANVIYRKLKAEGYDVFPVNPAADEVEGARCYRSLAAIDGGVDGVVVGSHPGTALAIIREAEAAGIRRVWLHRGFGPGSVSEDAVRYGQEHQVAVIAGGCPMMYVANADFAHRCMCWLLGKLGKLPDAGAYQPLLLAGLLALGLAAGASAQGVGRDTALVNRRWQLERELQGVAVIERKLMMPMRDGVRLATDVYRPKDAAGPVPTIFVKTPYNFNYWDVRNGAPRDMRAAINAVKRGYAYVEQNERGHFFSEGNYDILGPPRTDGYDAIAWIASQPWSNGKVGATGCSSTAEWQMGVAALGHPAFSAMIAQGFGAGVGRVGGYFEQGNWYRGGAVQMLFIAWLYSQQNQVRPMFPPGTTQEELVRAAKSFDLAQQAPPVDWSKALRHLPVQDIYRALDGPRGIFADSMPVPTGGRMIQRTPNDSAWYRGGLYHDDMPFNVPALWFMSWYDVSTGPNLAMFNHARKAASPEVADKQYAVIAPVLHCSYTRATENTVVGERSMGDARWNYEALTNAWFDHLLKGQQNGLLDTLPKVRYFTMGSNRWQSSDSWPPRGARPMSYFLSSGGRANTLHGDGRLVRTAPRQDTPDRFTYDPMDPVPSYGGNVCCTGNAIQGGAFDQQQQEAARQDILVYTTDPLPQGVEVSGPVELTLYVESDAKDTDFTVKLIDVYPDGRAYNLDETIQRMRYRDGYDREVWMEDGKVYKVVLGPMNTSNFFAPGHRIRIEVSSSNFPRFDRNLNTGGRNYDEASGVVAHNAVHHSRQYPSQLTLTVVPTRK